MVQPPKNNETNTGLKDPDRQLYYESYLSSLGDAVELTKINLIGYLAWSLCDNFEWSNGYTQGFGLCYVNVNDDNGVPRKRELKDYAKVFKKYVKDNTTGPLGTGTIIEGTTYGPTDDKDYWYYKTITPTGGPAPAPSSSALPRGRR